MLRSSHALAIGFSLAFTLSASRVEAWITLPNIEPAHLVRAAATHTHLLDPHYSVGSTGLTVQGMRFDSYTAVEGSLAFALDTYSNRPRGLTYDANAGVALGAIWGGFSLGAGLGSDAITRPEDDASMTLPPAPYAYLRPRLTLVFHKCFTTTIDVDGSLRTSRSHALKARTFATVGCIRLGGKSRLRFNVGLSGQWYPGIDLTTVGGMLGIEFVLR